MEDVAVSAVINKAVDIAATLVIEESSRLYWLREDILWLEQQMRLMQAYLQVAEESSVTNPMVATFIKGIRDLAHDVEDIFDIFLPQIQEHKSSSLLERMACILPYSVTCHKLSREIEKIKRRVERIEGDKKNYGIPDISSPDGADNSIVDPRTTTLDFDDSVMVGFDENIWKVNNMLKEHQFVSIVGMAGLGKTTLAKKVFKSVKDDFDCCASVSVSLNPNTAALLEDIATKLGLNKERQKNNLKVNLRAFLQEKRYVLLLDDVWRTETWDSLKDCFPIDSQSASRIIITSRYTGVGNYIGGESSVHQLLPFDFPTSWELFSKLILSSESDHPKLQEIGEEIVKKCGGVPLAIVVAVGMLRERGLREVGWNEVLDNIGHDADDKCSRIFALSYIDLPPILKPCFLYFGNFPEDYQFSSLELIRMWVAEKFIRRIGHREVEDVGKDYMRKLDSRNLIQVVERGFDGSVKKFKVHDLLYNLCIEKGREIDFLNTVDRTDPGSARKVRRLGVSGYGGILQYDMPKIRGLFHFGDEKEIQEKHLKRMLEKSRLLRVLAFRTTLFHLPTSVGSLSSLKYLQIIFPLQWCAEIPLSIQNLKNLETLIVRSFEIKIPIGIWRMKQLKHLNLLSGYLEYHVCDYYLHLLPFQRVQVSLPNIQTLYLPYLLQTYPNHCRILPKLTTLRKLSLRMVTRDMMEVLCGTKPISRSLETLLLDRFECGGSGVRMNLSKYSMLTELEIVYKSDLDLPDHDLPHSLIKVSLSSGRISDSIVEILKKLPKLKLLELIHFQFGSKMDCSRGFLQLEVLKLTSLDDLVELTEGEGEEMGMPKLRQFVIQHCRKLRIIPERLQQVIITKAPLHYGEIKYYPLRMEKFRTCLLC